MEATRERSTKISRINVDVDPELHRGLKMLAADRETTLRELISELLQTHLDEHAPEWMKRKAS